MFWNENIPSRKINCIGYVREIIPRKIQDNTNNNDVAEIPVEGYPYSSLTHFVASAGIHFTFLVSTSSIISSKHVCFSSSIVVSPSRSILAPEKPGGIYLFF